MRRFAPIPLLLLALAVTPVRADEDLSVKDAVLERQEGQDYFVVSGESRLPERARLIVTLAYQGREAKGFYGSDYVQPGGNYRIRLGPLEQHPLPGKYTAVVSFSLGEQHPAIRKILQANAEIRPIRLIEALPFTVGTPEEEVAARQEQSRAYSAILEQLAALIHDFLEGHAAFEKGDKFLDAHKNMNAETWGPWMDGLLKIVEQIDRQRTGLENSVLAPMFPEVHERTTTSIDVAHQVLLAVTRTQYQKAGIAIPEHYSQDSHFQNTFNDPKLLGIKSAEIQRALEILKQGTEDRPVTVGGTGKTRAEEVQEIQTVVRALLAGIEAQRKSLADHVASLGGAIVNPADYEAWIQIWIDALGKVRPKREVVNLDTAMTPEAMINLKYPYVYDLVEDLVHDLSNQAALETIRLYLAAKLEVPEKHLKKDGSPQDLTLERVTADLKSQAGIYQARLAHVCTLLKIELEKK